MLEKKKSLKNATPLKSFGVYADGKKFTYKKCTKTNK
jgi:hypothetical protein